MKLQLVKYKCSHCAYTFDAPALQEGAYGEFLLWSRNARVAYLNAFADPTLKEVDMLLAGFQVTKGMLSLARSKILHRVYGVVACDPDDQNARFHIDAYPPCLNCKNQGVSSWEVKVPTETIDVIVPPVTHHYWLSLCEEDKKAALSNALDGLENRGASANENRE